MVTRDAGRALGISVHTGWAACVVASGTAAQPEIFANQIIHVLDDAERFCFHMAADMQREAAAAWLAQVRTKAAANAKRALAPLLTPDVKACAIVAKNGDPGDLDAILASHPRLHTAEGCFYRDVLREACVAACADRVRIVPPATLDASKVRKLAPPPWGKDQKLALLAALGAIG